MRPAVTLEPVASLAHAYGCVRSAFTVRSVLACEPREGGLGGLTLTERPVPAPYVKDYDVPPCEAPSRWPERFDVSRWAVLAAHLDGVRVGGAVVAFDTPGVELLRGLRDLAVLWDLRVAEGARARGVGTALFRAAATWAQARGCRTLEVETQNVNVPACRFYARQGCELVGVRRSAYPELPHEVQLLWALALG